jgi:hypothetical protein
MSKKIIFFFLLLFSAGIVEAQNALPFDIPLMDRTWEMIARKAIKKNANGKETVIFPAPLQAMNNKKTDLSGYMVLMKMGLTHNVFMLAVVPAAQCQFCGTSGIPDMVEIHTVKPVRYSDEPITIVGKLVIKTSDPYSANVLLVDADIYK